MVNSFSFSFYKENVNRTTTFISCEDVEQLKIGSQIENSTEITQVKALF